jgi:DNA-damage-inducible protein J
MNSYRKGVNLVDNKLSNVSFRIDTEIKSQADRLFAELGLNMTTAFNIFLRQSVREGSIPFQITINKPNAETVAAMLEAESIASDPSVKRYSDVEEALRELKS